MYRDIAADKPRTITTVGLDTFVDPRQRRWQDQRHHPEEIVELIEFDGKTYLAYKTLPINVALLRGTTADTDGNITMEKEALTLESLAIATAARNSGGLVIVQVERIADRRTLNARQVKIPGIMVDCVVVVRARAPLADLCRTSTTPPSAAKSTCPCSPIAPHGDERPQDHRPPGGLRAASPTAWSTWASACPKASPVSPTRRRCSTTSP